MEVIRGGVEYEVAVGNAAVAHREDGAVGVTVEGHAQVGLGLARCRRHLLGIKRSAVLIDVAAVRPGVQDFGANTKPPHELRSNAARRAVRAVHHQSERREIEAGPDELRKVMGIELGERRGKVERRKALDGLRSEHPALDFKLHGIGELGPFP